MASQQRPSLYFKVYVRWRPTSEGESSAPEMERSVSQQGAKQCITLSSQLSSNRCRTWKSGASFAQVFPANATNSGVFTDVVTPMFPQVMDGGTCNIFAYGHSGSGKTHTIIGYDYEDDQQLGLCLSAAHNLFHVIEKINVEIHMNRNDRQANKELLGVAVRLYEVRGKCAYDLLNKGMECHVREGADGRTYIRGQTEVLENGKVRVRPVIARPCWSFAELRTVFLARLGMRKTGSSSIHDDSSRTHAVLELEIINKASLELRNAVIERESELVPVGKRATDIYLEEHKKTLIRTPEGKLVPDPEIPLNQERIDAAEAEKTEYENRLKAAEDAVAEYFEARQYPCLGGKFVFVDLAGSEYFDRGNDVSVAAPKQTLLERQQGRQINTDLFALKEVIRARALGQARTPFRSSPLTMILRSHFLVTNKAQSAMILTVSPSELQFAATLNTLKYGNLVAVAGENMQK
ncbi:hypothetical protein PV08_07332 [Exophiala spinifera]|uniref:Kinesin-like protein n=1 Tax=Exophiala spinifera TaxID=91928 RepID=A0A0D2B6Q2_9EURO|nr:uncharacterized protein PV08_07332 [Exophiala spinifera]KIW14548.1 hypothetical protein PV08_07332 [Exophiala spinifera]